MLDAEITIDAEQLRATWYTRYSINRKRMHIGIGRDYKGPYLLIEELLDSGQWACRSILRNVEEDQP